MELLGPNLVLLAYRQSCWPRFGGSRPRKAGQTVLCLLLQDPEAICPLTSSSKKLNFPAQTIEDVDVYDSRSNLIVVGNDNNFPYSSSRKAGKADENEMLVLEVGCGT